MEIVPEFGMICLHFYEVGFYVAFKHVFYYWFKVNKRRSFGMYPTLGCVTVEDEHVC